MKQSRIREWEENNSLINFNSIEEKQEKSKTQRRDVSFEFKSKLVVFRKNIQHFTGTVL